jgi:hypothetical protein
MSGIIETNDIVYVKEIVEMQTELKNDEIINVLSIKKGRGRPKKEQKPESDEPVVAKKKGRPKIENPCKSGYPKAGRDYYKAYYKSHSAGIIIPCPSCHALTEKFNLRNHIKSKMCAKYSMVVNCASASISETN